MSDLYSACGLWENETKGGDWYLSGRMGGLKILIFPNKNKKTPQSPDYSLCIAQWVVRDNDEDSDEPEPEPKKTGRPGRAPGKGPGKVVRKGPGKDNVPVPSDDDCPF